MVHEIRDQATRDWMQALPYVLQFREPVPDAVKTGTFIVLLGISAVFICSFLAVMADWPYLSG